MTSPQVDEELNEEIAEAFARSLKSRVEGRSLPDIHESVKELERTVLTAED